MYQPPKKDIQQLTNDDARVIRMTHCVTAAYLLRSVAKSYEDEVDDILKDSRLYKGEVKQQSKKINDMFQHYVDFIEKMFEVNNDDNSVLLHDFDTLKSIVEKNVTQVIKEFINNPNA